MALQEPLSFEIQLSPTLVAPSLTGRDDTWITVSHGNATLPFVVSRPNDDSGEANAVVLLLPGIGHYVENMHPLPLQGAIEHLWSNWPLKRPSLPAHGLWRDKQAHRLPGCCLTVLPGPRQCIQWKFYRSCWPSNVMRALASPHRRLSVWAWTG